MKKLLGLTFTMLLLLVGCSSSSSSGGVDPDELVAPSDGSIAQNTTIELSWSGEAESYEVYLSDSREVPRKIVDDYKSTSYIVPRDLSNGKTYYWKVVWNKSDGSRIESDVWSFTTGLATREELMLMLAMGDDVIVTQVNVSGITDMHDLFLNNSTFNQEIGGWDVSNVTNMKGMFCGATKFNQDISGWEVDKVKDMSYMFYNAKDFEADLSSWQVGEVTTMDNMFWGAQSFDSNIKNWDVSKVAYYYDFDKSNR